MRRLLLLMVLISVVFAQSKVWVTIGEQNPLMATRFDKITLDVDYSPVDSNCVAFLDNGSFDVRRGVNTIGNLEQGWYVFNVSCEFKGHSNSTYRNITVLEKMLRVTNTNFSCAAQTAIKNGTELLLPSQPVNLTCTVSNTTLILNSLELPFGTTNISFDGVYLSYDHVAVDKNTLGLEYDSFSIVFPVDYSNPEVYRCTDFDISIGKCDNPEPINQSFFTFDEATNKFTFLLSGGYIVRETILEQDVQEEDEDEAITKMGPTVLLAFFLAVVLFVLFLFLIRERKKKDDFMEKYYEELEEEMGDDFAPPEDFG